MKLKIFVCTLVVLACHSVMGSQDLPKGHPELSADSTCQLKDLPEHLRNDCVFVQCYKHTEGDVAIRFAECGLMSLTCSNGKEGRLREPVYDATKTHPDCCPRVICD